MKRHSWLQWRSLPQSDASPRKEKSGCGTIQSTSRDVLNSKWKSATLAVVTVVRIQFKSPIVNAKDQVKMPGSSENEDTTTPAEIPTQESGMVTNSRVQDLRDFLGLASPLLRSLKETEKAEYDQWRGYEKEELRARQRFEQIAKSPADVGVMIRGWRLEHPTPCPSPPVRELINCDAAATARRNRECSDHDRGLIPLSQDILWHSLTLVRAPVRVRKCQICHSSRGFTVVGNVRSRAMYRVPCGHHVHVACLEKDFEGWVEAESQGELEGGRDRACIRCKGLKDLVRGLPRKELEARVRRVGHKLLTLHL